MHNPALSWSNGYMLVSLGGAGKGIWVYHIAYAKDGWGRVVDSMQMGRTNVALQGWGRGVAIKNATREGGRGRKQFKEKKKMKKRWDRRINESVVRGGG